MVEPSIPLERIAASYRLTEVEIWRTPPASGRSSLQLHFGENSLQHYLEVLFLGV